LYLSTYATDEDDGRDGVRPPNAPSLSTSRASATIDPTATTKTSKRLPSRNVTVKDTAKLRGLIANK
jgi:hypothetical protein